MSIKSKVFAAAATLTLVGGVGSVAALSAGAATPSCGNQCLDLFSREFGTHQQPNYVMDVWRQGAKVGQPVILFRTSNTDPAEDFNTAFQGLTFVRADLPEERLPDRPAAAATAGPEPDRVHPGPLPARQPDRQRRRQPAVGRRLR